MGREINSRIRMIRKEKGMTQGDIARALGMKTNTYSKMERQGKITVEMAERIAKVMGVDADEIFYEKKETPLVLEPVIASPGVMRDSGENDLFGGVVGYKFGDITLSVKEELIIQRYRELSALGKKKFEDYLTNLQKNS